MDDYFQALTSDKKAVFSAIAEYAFDLGYKARKDKTRSPGYTFTHNKIKKLILRFATSRGKPILKMKFFASPDYSSYFQDAVRAVIEEYDYKYTGCYSCGKCNGTEGYTYRYPDGKEYYRCGTELIELVDIDNIPLQEVFELLKKQHDFYVAQIQKP